MADSDKYEVLEKIGHGSFGIIHKVRRKTDGLILCRKEISYNRMSQKEKEQLQSELSILKELRHPNIVQYHEREHLKVTQDLHLYMEYCGNGDLGQVIKRLKNKNQYAEEEFVWSIFAQLVSALYRCHYGEDPPDAGQNVMGLGQTAKPTKLKSKQQPYMILHRDLKPENVFLDEDNSVKLGDFGLSKILQSHDFASTYVGTPYYMSPEICAAERYSLYSDIWSLGCLLYELCAKEPPFNARTHIDLFHKIKTGRVAPIPPVYSAELQKVITSCLQVNPNARPDTCALLNLPVVKLMRKEQEVVFMGKQLKKRTDEVNDRIAKLDSDKEILRAELDASVRREWEVKARLEIDRQIKLEKERLERIFDAEVAKRVEERLATAQPSSNSLPPRSSTPVEPELVPLPPAAGDTSAEFSSLSLDSPPIPQQKEPTKRKASRTPFARAQTMFVNQAAASPMDVTMADPSPMSIKGLSLSPRRNGGKPPAQSRLNIFEIASSASELDESAEEDEYDDDDELPSLPSPTRDPFKALNKRPNLARQKTLPANTKRLASTPNLFAAAANRGQDVRPASAVPIVATSPARRPNPSPSRPKSGIGASLLSPVRKAAKDIGPKGKKDEGIHKTAMQNRLQGGLHGRTLVELNTHARNGGVDRSGKTTVKATVKELEPPVWDPESDDMPSPFLARKGRR